MFINLPSETEPANFKRFDLESGGILGKNNLDEFY